MINSIQTKGLLTISILIGISVLFFTSCAPHSEAESETKKTESVPVADLVKQSDELFQKRLDPEKLKESITFLARARNPDQRNFEVEWKYARANYFLGKQTSGEAEADKLLKDGYTAGLIASRINADSPEGYFWAGACLGEQSRRSPLTVGLKSTGEIKELMNKVIAVKPDYQGASAFDALAQLELATRLTGGSADKAIEYLKKGLEHSKENGYIYLHLAEAYLANQNQAEAKKSLEHIFKMKTLPEYEVERIEIHEKAKKMLDTKF